MKKEADNLKWLEKRAYLTYHRDGLADLALGILVLLFGIGMKYDQTMLAPIYGCVGYPIWLLMKRWITERRLGYAEFGTARKSREKRGWVLLFMLGCLVFVLGIMAYMAVIGGGGLPGLRGYLMISVIFAVLISSIGLVLELARLHLYSVMILFIGSAGHMLEWKPESCIILPGSLIVVTGAALLISFLIKYPATGMEPEALAEGKGDRES